MSFVIVDQVLGQSRQKNDTLFLDYSDLLLPDFGLAKDLYSSDYYQVEGQRKLPVRWMAPEALLQGKFTMEADIW